MWASSRSTWKLNAVAVSSWPGVGEPINLLLPFSSQGLWGGPAWGAKLHGNERVQFLLSIAFPLGLGSFYWGEQCTECRAELWMVASKGNPVSSCSVSLPTHCKSRGENMPGQTPAPLLDPLLLTALYPWMPCIWWYFTVPCCNRYLGVWGKEAGKRTG